MYQSSATLRLSWPGWARQGKAGGTLKNYRRGRLVLSSTQEAPFRWRPWLLNTWTRVTDPWIWRLYWFRWCLGLLKANWNKPVQLTRQLRRQLERKGRLVLGPDGVAPRLGLR